MSLSKDSLYISVSGSGFDANPMEFFSSLTGILSDF